MSITKYVKSLNIEFEKTLDIDELLKDIDVNDYNYLCNRTNELILQTLHTLPSILDGTISKINNKLGKYRLIDEIYLLHKGKHVRWVNKNDSGFELHIGGVVVDTRFMDNGTHIVIFNKYTKRNIQIQFDKVLLFQKLSFDEQIVLELKRTI